MRIVSLAPSNTEIVHALGLIDSLVGVDDWSDWPPQTADLPRVGPDLKIDVEQVAALKPDLVLASLSVPGMEANIARLEARALPFIILDPHGLEEIWTNIRLVGAHTGTRDRAEALVAELSGRVESVRAAAGSRHRPRLYWEWWPKPIYTPGRRNWLTEVSAIVGGVNLFSDHDADNVRVDDPGEVLRRHPDYVLLAWTGARTPRAELIRRRPGWGELPAVREGRVLVLEEGLFNRPSPRLVDGIERLHRLLG